MNISEIAKFRGGVSVDTISELTSASGVTVDGVLFKDSAVSAASGVSTNTITEYSSGSGVTIDSLLIKDGEARWIMPAGLVSPYAGATAPAGWLLCDGSAVSRTTYATLFAVLSTTFGVGDGSTTFNVPDMRETAPVGVGTRGAGVTAHDTYTLGQFKDDQMQGHRHRLLTAGTNYTRTGSGDIADALNLASPLDVHDDRVRDAITDGTNGTPRTGTTTHGKQIGLNYIIKT